MDAVITSLLLSILIIALVVLTFSIIGWWIAILIPALLILWLLIYAVMGGTEIWLFKIKKC